MSEREVLQPDLPAGLLDRGEGHQRFRPRRGHGRGEDQHREDRRHGGHPEPARRGHHVKMKIPLTLAIIPGADGDQRRRPLRHPASQPAGTGPAGRRAGAQRASRRSTARRSIACAGSLLPLVYLNQRTEARWRGRSPERRRVNIVVLQADDRQFGLVVDEINDTEEIVVKPLGKQLKGITRSPAPRSWATAGWR